MHVAVLVVRLVCVCECVYLFVCKVYSGPAAEFSVFFGRVGYVSPLHVSYTL